MSVAYLVRYSQRGTPVRFCFAEVLECERPFTGVVELVKLPPDKSDFSGGGRALQRDLDRFGQPSLARRQLCEQPESHGLSRW